MESISEKILRTDNVINRGPNDAEPTIDDDGGPLPVGRELYRSDSGGLTFWNGTAWGPVTTTQKLCQIADFLREIRDLLSNE